MLLDATTSFRIARAYRSGGLDAGVVVRAARRCGFTVVSEHALHVTLRTNINLASFRENIEVALSEVDGITLLDVTSRCVLPTILQVADLGKNEANVRRLLADVDWGLIGKTEFDVIEICSACGYLLVGITSESCPECGVHITHRAKPRLPIGRLLLFGAQLSTVFAATFFLGGAVLDLFDVITISSYSVFAIFWLTCGFLTVFGFMAFSLLYQRTRRRIASKKEAAKQKCFPRKHFLE